MFSPSTSHFFKFPPQLFFVFISICALKPYMFTNSQYWWPCSPSLMLLNSTALYVNSNTHPDHPWPQCPSAPRALALSPAPPIHKAQISPGQSCGRPCRRTRPPGGKWIHWRWKCGWNDVFSCLLKIHIKIGGTSSYLESWGIILIHFVNCVFRCLKGVPYDSVHGKLQLMFYQQKWWL